MKVEYKGETFETQHYVEVSDEFREQVKALYFQKPPFENVLKEFNKIINEYGCARTNITKYYFRPIMSKVKVNKYKWCIEDIFESKQLLGCCMGLIKAKPKVYKPYYPIDYAIETVLRLGGVLARKPTLFPIKTVRYLLEKYCFNGNYYDYSCGWGDRLLGAIAEGVHYYGTDPNYLLTEKLHEMNSDIVNNNFGKNKLVDIRTTGSEFFQEDWENKMSFCFSSPPYFKLEEYQVGEQSTDKYSNYNDWLELYLRKTIENCRRYLVDGGFFGINIKDYASYKLVEDSRKIIESLGFEFVCYEFLPVHGRPKQTGDLLENNEDIMIFKKV